MSYITKEGNNTYTVRYDKPREKGEPRKEGKIRGFLTEGDAKLALAKLDVALLSKTFINTHDGNMIIKDFRDNVWLPEMKENCKKIKTYLFYEDRSKTISEYLGSIPLKNLRQYDIKKMFRALEKAPRKSNKKPTDKPSGEQPKPVSASTVHHTYKALRKMLNDAIEWEFIRESPLKQLKRQDVPRLPKAKTKYWTPEQIQIALEYFKGTTIGFHVFVAIHTGMREGEICAINKQQIDFKVSTYTIAEKCFKHERKMVFETPKSDNPDDEPETVYLIPSVIKVIEEHMNNMPESLEYPGYLSVWEDGRFMDPGYVSKRFHKILLQQNELPIIRFHDLRHSCAVWLLSEGVDMKTLQKILRHDDFSVTANTYADVLEDNKKASMLKLESKVKKTGLRPLTRPLRSVRTNSEK